MGTSEDSHLLKGLFAAAGYHVTDSAGGWTAVRPRDRRCVIFTEEVRSPSAFDGAFPHDAIHRVLLYPSDPGPVARSLAAERGIEVFDPAAIGSALGELLLLPANWSPGSPEESRTPLQTPPAVFPQGRRIIRERLSREQAMQLAESPDLRATLRLVPFFVAPYRVRSPTPHGGPGASTEHTVAVNALSRSAESWDPTQYELADSSSDSSPRLQPTLSIDQAQGIALDWIRATHAVRVEHTEQHLGTVVVETRRVPPSPEDVRLAPLTLVYVPFWYFEGESGRVVIDAVTGKVAPSASFLS